MIPALGNHLWQSTAFAAGAWLLTFALRGNRAQTRYWIWMGASVKFLLPFSLLTAIGRHLEWKAAAASLQHLPVRIATGQPFEVVTFTAPAAIAPNHQVLPAILAIVWFIGFAGVVYSAWTRWRRIRSAIQAASSIPLEIPVDLRALSCVGPRAWRLRYPAASAAPARGHRGSADPGSVSRHRRP